jgi:hypothetical protein
MKSIFIGCVAAALALTAGCTVKETRVEQAPAAVIYGQPNTTTMPPTVAYTVMGQGQFNQAATQAADWCVRNNYGPGARLIDKRQGVGGDVVTFECSIS